MVLVVARTRPRGAAGGFAPGAALTAEGRGLSRSRLLSDCVIGIFSASTMPPQDCDDNITTAHNQDGGHATGAMPLGPCHWVQVVADWSHGLPDFTPLPRGGTLGMVPVFATW